MLVQCRSVRPHEPWLMVALEQPWARFGKGLGVVKPIVLFDGVITHPLSPLVRRGQVSVVYVYCKL